MPGRAAKVIITERQQQVLQTMTRSSTCPQARAQRARMILLAFEGWSNEDIADRVGCERHAVGIWRRRWAEAFPRLVLVECCEKESALPHAIEDLLGDLPRSGCPGKFTAEQVTQVLAVACEPPEDSGRPVTHWTPRELADEVTKRGIVQSIFRPTRRAFFKIQPNSSPTAVVIGSMRSPLTRRRSNNRCRAFVPATWRRPVSWRRQAPTRSVSMR